MKADEKPSEVDLKTPVKPTSPAPAKPEPKPAPHVPGPKRGTSPDTFKE